jgi:hypothetical protein
MYAATQVVEGPEMVRLDLERALEPPAYLGRIFSPSSAFKNMRQAVCRVVFFGSMLSAFSYAPRAARLIRSSSELRRPRDEVTAASYFSVCVRA